MIQFALLFGLGFLSAALLAILIAPAIHGRIVRYTENRLKATLPISPQEVRAQRDMARAVYAAENARTSQELAQERDGMQALRLRYDQLTDEARRLQSDNHDLNMQIGEMDVEAADLRARLRREDSYIQQLKAAIEASEEAAAAKDDEIEAIQQRMSRIAADTDNLRIDLSARDTEVENLKFRITTLRDEREVLRNDLKLQTSRAKDAEARLAQEESRTQRLEDKIAREIASRTDKETALERRLQEIARLKDKLKLANTQARAAARTLREVAPNASIATARKAKLAPQETRGLQEPPQALAAIETLPRDFADAIAESPELAALADEAHNRATALSERLTSARPGVSDAAIREEMVSIAADMVSLTARAEGPASPIHAMLSGRTVSRSDGRENLATRARKAIPPPEPDA